MSAARHTADPAAVAGAKAVAAHPGPVAPTPWVKQFIKAGSKTWFKRSVKAEHVVYYNPVTNVTAATFAAVFAANAVTAKAAAAKAAADQTAAATKAAADKNAAVQQ